MTVLEFSYTLGLSGTVQNGVRDNAVFLCTLNIVCEEEKASLRIGSYRSLCYGGRGNGG